MADWEGRRIPLRISDLDWLELGYAISIHKAQGSQFPRVIVPILPGRLLDRTLIYTACTRAESQIILVGDVQAMRKAVEAVPRAHLRRVALPRFLAA
jgi:exodeoxyribonuclease V alpha subunit